MCLIEPKKVEKMTPPFVPIRFEKDSREISGALLGDISSLSTNTSLNTILNNSSPFVFENWLPKSEINGVNNKKSIATKKDDVKIKDLPITNGIHKNDVIEKLTDECVIDSAEPTDPCSDGSCVLPG